MENQNYQYVQQPIPNATTVLVLGILSIVFCGLVGLILGIIALSMSGKEKTKYETSAGAYTLASINNMKAGRTCAIIGVSLSSVIFVISIFYFLFAGLFFAGLASHI